ncbi:DUF262 domain-containing protein [Vibrio lentus]|uniref:DUF262 domain-containing protein n=1 Tax=Vibrio lentus TaxID=136468 RepID=UPI000C8185BD|nr:DUF262 domain-containing protein [Vibrio lentus]PMG19072.1 hypothetical protein BCU96_09675 [Vibrio lentus]PMH16521.1 hypothetical protein BCU76_01125 [Vibrio lentus]PMJ12109.1 hypothetical protein BCU30_17670 [Vibrio lentus]PMK94949.1 hypothetical protein BCT89_14325 [Vibrio lentus]PMN17332.1 hypothetical protein BCT39_16300 [Vibrio lentus]
MNKGKRLTFYGLFDVVEAIEIPILQRDYAQGRKEELEVRTLFLSSLFQALNKNDESRQPLDLDFVYGNFEDGQLKAFSVLDGQQRLTTLFLLHWYLAVQHGHIVEFRNRFVTSEKRSRFTYKTRPSTTEFFDALTSKDIELSGIDISKQINNSQWFYLSWQQDPTVQACLNMLDAIQTLFPQSDINLYERIINTREPYITFQFLDLHSFGLSDELYIKMNARGKPLTIFENFKAKLEQKIKCFEGPWPEYSLPFKDNASGYEYFIHKVDTDWADLFWPFRNVCSEDDTFDDELMNFIRLIVAYQYLIEYQDSPLELNVHSGELFGKNGRLEALTLSQYEALGCLNKQFFVRLISFLDVIYRDGIVNSQIQGYLETEYYYDEQKTFKNILKNDASYDDKLRFYAFYNYVAKATSDRELNEWLRVIFNLTENTIINTSDEFNKALFAIDKLCQSGKPILDILADDIEIAGFAGAQVLEEKIKAHLLLKSDDWREAIVSAENHPFLKGQVGCILNFAEILSYYREHKHCNWNDYEDNEYLARFKLYSEALQNVFSQISSSSSSIDYLWERAVLSKGNYFTNWTGNRHSLLSTRLTKNNIKRDHSWKRLLRIHPGGGGTNMEPRQALVKAVVDDPLFDSDDITTSLMAICSTAIEAPTTKAWIRLLIKHPGLFEVCEQGFISITAEEIILLCQSQRNHYHFDLYTKSLEIELTTEHIGPFSKSHTTPVKSSEDWSCCDISGAKYQGKSLRLSVGFYKENFHIWLKGISADNENEELTRFVSKHGFDSGYLKKVPKTENDLSEIKQVIRELCTGLKDLCDE